MIVNKIVRGCAALGMVASTPVAAVAQGWTADLHAGRAVYDPVSSKVGANSAALGLRHLGLSGAWFYLTAAAPLSEDAPYWGATGLGRRLAFVSRRVAAGVDFGAHGYGYKNPDSLGFGAGATLEAVPVVGVTAGALAFDIYSGVAHHSNTFSGQSLSRTIHDSGARLLLRPPRLEFRGDAGVVRAAEGNYSYANGAVTLDHGNGDIWGSVGHWFSDAIPDFSWSTGASIRFGDNMELWAIVRQDATNPLYWNSTRQSWNIGASRRLGKRSAARAVPVAVSAGTVTIRIAASEVRGQPYVAGDFSQWKPLAMARVGQFWSASVTLKPGLYHYAFVDPDGNWFVPASVSARIADGFGGHVVVLVVQ